MDSILSLPQDLLFEIQSWISDPHDYRNFQLTCKGFCQIRKPTPELASRKITSFLRRYTRGHSAKERILNAALLLAISCLRKGCHVGIVYEQAVHGVPVSMWSTSYSSCTTNWIYRDLKGNDKFWPVVRTILAHRRLINSIMISSQDVDWPDLLPVLRNFQHWQVKYPQYVTISDEDVQRMLKDHVYRTFYRVMVFYSNLYKFQ